MGGVHFPLYILFSYRISSSHTTPFMGEEYVKRTSQLCRQVSRCWKVFFMPLSAPETPETWDSSKSLIHQLTEVIQAWRYWYANKMVQLKVCRTGLYPKSSGSIPDTFLCRSHNDPPVNGSCECLTPNTLGLDLNPDIEMDGWKSPLQISTPLIKVTGDPYWGGQVSSVRR